LRSGRHLDLLPENRSCKYTKSEKELLHNPTGYILDMRPVLSFLALALLAPAAQLPVRNAPARVEGPLKLTRNWSGNLCRSRLTNAGPAPVRAQQIVLFDISHTLPPETRLYGESFQMLSQTTGTLGEPKDLGYSEIKHYRIPQPADARALTGMMTLRPPSGQTILLAFTSARRFNGRFFLRPQSIQVVLDLENLVLEPGESWELEEFMYAEGPDRPKLLALLAAAINRNHPPLNFSRPPTGWCSWYCFGPKVTAQQVLENLDVIAKDIPALRYVQIDDGYQPAMGDWLETGNAFGGDVQGVLKQIRLKGFEPAIWVAPFIAEAGSHVFQQHPDWFVKGDDGRPLPSNQVTFGGWRRGPWYALDGTNPAVQTHLEETFRTMRRQWGTTYFKLDANFWGAMHSGRFHDPKATRIEAYRRGMQAILRGAGDSFILGCNHPIWASFGLIHGSRSSGDISRRWRTISTIARENLNRNWQNGRLWWNDPDALVLAGDLPYNEFQFHATAVFASGGMILSGDDLTKIPPDRLEMLRKLLPPTATAAEFEDETLQVGRVQLKGALAICLFNWDDTPKTVPVRLPKRSRITDFWTGREVTDAGELPPHSARLLICRPN
jgi:alpha-galactosidase